MKNPLQKRVAKPTGRQRVVRSGSDGPARSFSYYSKRPDQNFGSSTGRQAGQDVANRSKERMQSIWIQRLKLTLILIGLTASAFSIVTLSGNAKIQPITEDTASLRNTSTYQSAANEILAESAANKSKLTIDTKEVSTKLQKKFPELTTVSVAVPLVARRPVVYIQVAQPAIVLSASSGSFVVGTSGTVLASSSQVASSVRDKLPVVSDQSELPLSEHTQVLASSNVQFIQTVAEQMKAKGYKVSGITLPRTTGELDVQIAGQPYFVKFNIHSKTAKEQAGTFFATMAQLQKQKAAPAQYVDVRVEGRSYYK